MPAPAIILSDFSTVAGKKVAINPAKAKVVPLIISSCTFLALRFIAQTWASTLPGTH